MSGIERKSGKYKHYPHQGFQKEHPFYGDLSKLNYFKKGEHRSPKTEFKKGNVIPKEMRKKISEEHRGEKAYNWKGNKIGYYGLHIWVNKWLGKPNECVICGIKGRKLGRFWSIQWANIDHSYKRNLIDWIGLCAKCHKKYDFENNN